VSQGAQPQGAASAAGHGQGTGDAHGHTGKRLGWFLCWAVVFADIGTSVYYVPGILYQQPGIGRLAGFFVLLTLGAFLLLVLKYAEVSVRFPEGGGVVTVATHGLNPWAGAVGGMFILVDYFLTSAISSLSGLLYFNAVIPELHIKELPTIQPFWILMLTLGVLVLLGVLNWWGIKESAVVSAVIAMAAFVSDMLILLVIAVRVPMPTIAAIFREMFAGKGLTGLTLLTGFAGAFLAFSGLESISQLSPVMALPRKKVVSRALAFVVVTVGITSPLLTIFSTVLLTDERFAGTMRAPRYAVGANPDQFISLLAGAYGGRLLEVLVAVTAAALLIFASNTAIIGAYHVFLALSRMRFFPSIVERTDKRRGTPIVSIALATGIPIAVLVVVQGNITILGDLYAFGLLGAFSLTCLSMDIIRWRERHGGPHVGAEVDPELVGANGHVAAPAGGGASAWAAGPTADLRARLGRVAADLRPLRKRLEKPASDATYSLGFVTTLLVGTAWVVNLFAKPHATVFGGGITLFGVAVAVAHFRYQQRRGEPVVFVDVPAYTPDSWLVVLTPDGPNRQVIQAAVDGSGGRPLVFLYLATKAPEQPPPRIFEIQNRFGMDREAQRTLSRAKRRSAAANAPARYLYAIGGAKQVFDIARRVRPDEIVAEEHVAKRISRALPSESGMAVAPDYVRYTRVDGVNVAHNVLHELFTQGPDASASRRGPSGRGAGDAAPRAGPVKERDD